MAKNLPIKLFKKRENDKLLNNIPGGSSEGNKFKLQGDALTARANYFRQYFSGLSQKVNQKIKSNNYLPTIVKLKINEEALAKTYRGEIGRIFNQGRKINIIGLIGEDQLLIKVDNPSDLLQIEAKILDYENNVLGISAVEKAEDFVPIINIDEKGKSELKIRLFNYGDYRLNEIAQLNFENLCRQLNIQYQKLNYTKDLLLYRVSNIRPQALTNFNESESIFSITKMPVMMLSKSELIEEGNIEIKK